MNEGTQTIIESQFKFWLMPGEGESEEEEGDPTEEPEEPTEEEEEL